MFRLLLVLLAITPFSLTAHDVPPPVVNAVVSAAGTVTEVSPGGIATVWGLDFAEGPEVAGTLPLPVQLGLTRVFINGVECPLFFVSEFQINLQIPFETPKLIEVNVQVEHDGVLGDKFAIIVQPVAMSVFTYERVPGSGEFEPIVLHSDGISLVTPDNPALAGEILVLYLTGPPQLFNTPLSGVGAPLPPNDAITVELPSALLTTSLAGQGLVVLYSGLASGFVGLWQINVQMPAPLPAGENHNLRLTAEDSRVVIPLPITE